ncbi:MAG: AAA family ATPase [Lachnospiraceae bacterium]|nr:AAA family ATPase [Lachnospiraceae bacterium]
MNENWKTICSGIPQPPDWSIGWDFFWKTPLASYLDQMAETLQNPFWHAEGDVLTHTKMVCEQLTGDPLFREQTAEKRQILFLAALLHDIGKIPCTKMEDGVWKSPNHTVVGEKMARELLWKTFSLAGTTGEQQIRECICTLIRFHSVPSHVCDQKKPELRLWQIAAQGELIPDFSLSLLSILVHADLKGRISETLEESLETVELCFSMAEEEGILDGPGSFPSDVTRYAYLSGKNVWRGQELYDDTWGEVILMAGLPGTGKDTWVKEHCTGLPVISLDEIRRELHISPDDNQGRVIQEAREQAKKLLRAHQPFVWNATDLSSMIRRKQLLLFDEYHARTRIVFLETGWETGLARNEKRVRQVPERVIAHMLKNLELPQRREARTVEWHCV